MKADEVGTGVGKGAGQCIYRLHHQVHINGHGHARGGFGVWFQGAANHWPEGQVGHVVVVHHVKVNPVAAGGNHVFDFIAQTGKIGGQNRRGDTVGHGSDLLIRRGSKGINRGR